MRHSHIDKYNARQIKLISLTHYFSWTRTLFGNRRITWSGLSKIFWAEISTVTNVTLAAIKILLLQRNNRIFFPILSIFWHRTLEIYSPFFSLTVGKVSQLELHVYIILNVNELNDAASWKCFDRKFQHRYSINTNNTLILMFYAIDVMWRDDLASTRSLNYSNPIRIGRTHQTKIKKAKEE